MSVFVSFVPDEATTEAELITNGLENLGVKTYCESVSNTKAMFSLRQSALVVVLGTPSYGKKTKEPSTAEQLIEIKKHKKPSFVVKLSESFNGKDIPGQTAPFVPFVWSIQPEVSLPSNLLEQILARLRGLNAKNNKLFLKVILLGDPGVGKSSFWSLINPNRLKQPPSTTGGTDLFKKELTIKDESVILEVWDTAGQERFQSLAMSYYRDASCCLLMFDLGIKKTFENLLPWMQEVDSFIGENSIQFVVVGNKLDKPREVSKEEVQKFCQEKKLKYYEISVTHNINVDTAMEQITEIAFAASRTNPKYRSGLSVGEAKKPATDKGCCA